MWEIIYDMLTKIILYSTIALGTVEKIMEGKQRKGDELSLLMAMTKIAKLSANLYMTIRIYLKKTREPYRCYYKHSADTVKVGGHGLITDHALVSNAFIPLMESVALVAENLFKNKLVDIFHRKQRTFGMYHVGHKIYAGRCVSMRLCVSPERLLKYLVANTNILSSQVHVIIHDTYVEVYFKKSIKKGESVITTNPPLCGLPEKNQIVISAGEVSQKEVNVLL